MDASLPTNRFPHTIHINGDLVPIRRIKTVVLSDYHDECIRMYFCPDCRSPVMKYKGEVMTEIDSDVPYTMGVDIPCRKGNACGRIIRVIGFIQQIY